MEVRKEGRERGGRKEAREAGRKEVRKEDSNAGIDQYVYQAGRRQTRRHKDRDIIK